MSSEAIVSIVVPPEYEGTTPILVAKDLISPGATWTLASFNRHSLTIHLKLPTVQERGFEAGAIQEMLSSRCRSWRVLGLNGAAG